MPSTSRNCKHIRAGLTAAVLAALTAAAHAQEVRSTEAPTKQARTNLTKTVDAEIKLTRLRELNITLPNGQQGFVSSASGLVHVGRYFHVVSDDELHLASFLVGSEQPGQLLRLLPGDLPEAPAARKKTSRTSKRYLHCHQTREIHMAHCWRLVRDHGLIAGAES